MALVLAPAAGAAAPAGEAGGLVTPTRYDRPPAGWTRTPSELLHIADALPEVRHARASHALTYRRAYLQDRAKRRWQVSYFAPPGRSGGRTKEVAQVLVDDRSARVLERWTGPQVEWTMARGYAGAFGGVANAPWIWIGFCLLFLAPFLRPPWRLLHLDLAVLLSFSISYAYFSAARIDVSVPLAYPGLLYLLARMLAIAVGRSRGRTPRTRAPLRLLVPARYLGIGAVFLLGVRTGLDVLGSGVIDVGYASVVGADRLAGGQALYGAFPPDIAHGDTYGPIAYLAYVPFEQLAPWSGSWDGLPAAHAAAIAFDVLCTAGLWLLGNRVCRPVLGALLAWGWASYPFSLLALQSNGNDGLVALLVIAALLALGSPARRGALVAAAGLAKFAPLVLAPLALTYRGGLRADAATAARPSLRALGGLALVGALVLVPLAATGELARFYERTLGFQADRGSPFSVWGLYGGLEIVQAAVLAGATALALAVAFVPRRRDIVVVCALATATLAALQLALDHWFYLYLVWLAPTALVALLAPYAEPEAGSSTDSIESARPGEEARMSTALSQGSSSDAS